MGDSKSVSLPADAFGASCDEEMLDGSTCVAQCVEPYQSWGWYTCVSGLLRGSVGCLPTMAGVKFSVVIKVIGIIRLALRQSTTDPSASSNLFEKASQFIFGGNHRGMSAVPGTLVSLILADVTGAARRMSENNLSLSEIQTKDLAYEISCRDNMTAAEAMVILSDFGQAGNPRQQLFRTEMQRAYGATVMYVQEKAAPSWFTEQWMDPGIDHENSTVTTSVFPAVSLFVSSTGMTVEHTSSNTSGSNNSNASGIGSNVDDSSSSGSNPSSAQGGIKSGVATDDGHVDRSDTLACILALAVGAALAFMCLYIRGCRDRNRGTQVVEIGVTMHESLSSPFSYGWQQEALEPDVHIVRPFKTLSAKVAPEFVSFDPKTVSFAQGPRAAADVAIEQYS